MAAPVLAAMVAWLLVAGQRAVAAVLAVDAAATVACTVALKLVSRHAGGAFFGTPWHLTTGAPSGHAAVSTVVYGGIAAVFLWRGRGVARVIGIALALALMAAVDVTRITLGYHSPADVATGLAIGLLAVVPVAIATRASARHWPSLLPVLLALLAVAATLQVSGIRFDSNAVL